MIDEEMQKKYNKAIKRLRSLSFKQVDDKVAVALLAEEIDVYRNGIERRNKKITNLIAENEKLRKIIIKQALQMYGDNND